MPKGSEEAYQRNAMWGKFFMTDYLDAVSGLKYRLNVTTKTAMLVRNLDAADGTSLYANSEYVIPFIIRNEKGEEFSVTELDDYCFSGCSELERVVLPNTVRKIGASCFSGCSNLKMVTLSENLTYLPDRCFYGCENIVSIDLPNGITEIGACCFESCGSLQSVRLPGNLQTLGAQCFGYCHSLQDADLTSKITILPGWTFNGCETLQKVTLPVSLQKIDDDSFQDCKSLKEITIPEDVKEMGCAFCGANLQTLVCQAKTPPTILSDNLFVGYQEFATCKLVVPEGCENVYKKTSVWERFYHIYQTDADNELLYDLNPNTQTAMLLRSDKNKMRLNLEVSETRMHDGVAYIVTEMEPSCFQGCNHLESIVLPATIEELPSLAFANCTSLKQVQLPAQLKKMGQGCFEWSSIEKITLPHSLEEIEESCFAGTLLKSIVVPANVKKIGRYALNADNLESIYCEGSEPAVANDLLYNSSHYSSITLYVPTGSVSRYKASEEWGKFANIEEYVPTSIVGVRSHAASTTAPVYTIDGKKVAASVKSLPKGIYVSGGKKVVVK